MAEDAISEVLFRRPSPLNRRHGSALHPFLPGLHAAQTLSLPRSY